MVMARIIIAIVIVIVIVIRLITIVIAICSIVRINATWALFRIAFV